MKRDGRRSKLLCQACALEARGSKVVLGLALERAASNSVPYDTWPLSDNWRDFVTRI